MNILYICHRFPYPPKRGGKIRPFNMIKHLSRNHKVSVVSIVRSDEEAREAEGIKEYCHRYTMVALNNGVSWIKTVLNLLGPKPSSFGYFHSGKMTSVIEGELEENEYDLIFVHCSSVAPYVATVKLPKIIDFGDMDSQKWLDYAKFKPFPFSMGYKLEGYKLERQEKWLARQFDYSSCTTKAELDTLQSFQVTENTFWFPNGVDFEFFKPDGKEYKKNTICFIGRMDYYPNQECVFDFCKNVFPAIKAKIPDATFTIVGANPTPKVKALANINGIDVTGSVEDVRPYVLRSAVNVAPLNIARGTQNKILESMAMGVPVIASPLAAKGIDAVAETDFLVASSPEDYVKAVLRLFEDPKERDRLASNGRKRMIERHNWKTSMQKLDVLIEDCMSLYNSESKK